MTSLSVTPILLPLGRRLAAEDWQRVACRRPMRADLVKVRQIIDQLQPDEPCPALDRVANAGLPVILQFMNAMPDLTFLCLSEDYGGTHLRCSRNLGAVRDLVRASWNRDAMKQPVDCQPPVESDRIRRRRDQSHAAVRQLVELLIERTDVSLVVLWRVEGSVSIGEECSIRMCPDERRRRIRWFAQHVLGMEIEFVQPFKPFPFSTK